MAERYPVRVAIITLGCAKNEVDSNDMYDRLVAADCLIVDEAGDADCVIVNTCAFIRPAIEESLETIFDVSDIDGFAERGGRLIVAGCLPSLHGAELEKELTEGDLFVPCAAEDDIVEKVLGLFPEGGYAPAEGLQSVPAVNSDSSASAYVKISDGCDRFCSYCTIPLIRGRYHSFPLDDILDEASRRVEEGARELVLVAQDTGIWGHDFAEPDRLAHLLDVLAKRYDDVWIRVMYLQPEGIDDELLDVMRRHDNICDYLDIPLQHCDANLLTSMNRTGDADSFLKMIDEIRHAVPDVTLRTTLIAGLPGETEEAHGRLCDFVQNAGFDYLGVFPYSAEPNTAAAKMDGQVDGDTILRRAQELRDIADAVSTARISQRIGTRQQVLVLGTEEDGQLFGRTRAQGPDVDGVTYIDAGSIGSIVEATIEDTLLYDVEGTVS